MFRHVNNYGLLLSILINVFLYLYFKSFYTSMKKKKLCYLMQQKELWLAWPNNRLQAGTGQSNNCVSLRAVHSTSLLFKYDFQVFAENHVCHGNVLCWAKLTPANNAVSRTGETFFGAVEFQNWIMRHFIFTWKKEQTLLLLAQYAVQLYTIYFLT